MRIPIPHTFPLIGGILAALALSVAAPFAIRSATADHGEVNARAGDGVTGFAVNEFLPEDVTIHEGDTITWDFPWFEPHSVSFGAPPDGESAEAPSVPLDQVHEFDGESYFSSGLLAPEFSEVTTFSVEFTTPGEYSIYCAIHPFMTGTVTVVEAGEEGTDTQDDLDTRGEAEYQAALADLMDLADTLEATPVEETPNDDGTTTYSNIASGATQQGDVMQFFPAEQTITAGDSILWDNDTPVPHTVTFNVQDYPGGDPFAVPPYPAEDGFDGTGFVHSGIIGVGFPDGQTFEVQFLEPGTYEYVCILHANQGMVGTVVVEEDDEDDPTPTPTETQPAPTPTATQPAPTATPTQPDPTPTATTEAPEPPDTGTGSGGTFGAAASPWYLLGALFIVAGAGVVVFATRRA